MAGGVTFILPKLAFKMPKYVVCIKPKEKRFRCQIARLKIPKRRLGYMKGPLVAGLEKNPRGTRLNL